jgi:hypothetical protein
MKISFIFIILFLPAFQTFAQTSVSDLDPIHQTVLHKWLATQKGWRLALERDYEKESLDFLRLNEKNARPFYVSEDFNGDRKKDFAVILINGRKKFAAAVFNAPFDLKKTQKPAFFTTRIDAGDIVIFNKNSNRLLIGPYASDAGFILEPNGKTYRAESMLPEN